MLQRTLRNMAFGALRLFQRVNPAVPGNRVERMVRRIGFFRAPAPAEIVANYLRGFLLFGRESPSRVPADGWFHWYWVPERAVITRQTASVPRRLRPLLHRADAGIRFDQDMEEIVHRCAAGRVGWLTEPAVAVYLEMLRMGLVASVGVYRDGRLVGGLWGLAIRRTFALMSMFHSENNAGALALAALTESVGQEGRFALIDCGGPSANWDRYGAKTMPVEAFTAMVTGDLLGANLTPPGERAPAPELMTAAGEGSME